MPKEKEQYKLKVTEDLIPKDYFLNYFPQKWFEHHAWLFDDRLKKYAPEVMNLPESQGIDFTKRNLTLMEETRKNPAKLALLKEQIWEHFYVTGVRFEPCFPAMPTAKDDKDFLKCGLHALFLVAQVIVDGKAYGSANTLNTQTKKDTLMALKDFADLREISGFDTAKLPIYIHPGFTGQNSARFFSQTVTVFKKYFGLKTLFGSAFSSRSVEYTAGVKKETLYLNANAAPLKFKSGQTTLPQYARSADQDLYIESYANGTHKVSIDLDPPSVGPLPRSVWESDFGPGLEKKPTVALEGILKLANSDSLTNASKDKVDLWLSHSYVMDDPSRIAINKESCVNCHLSSAIRYRVRPNITGPKFTYDVPSATQPEQFDEPEKALHPKVMEILRNQVKNNQWVTYHHGYIFGTDLPIVSGRHVNEMFAVTKMVNLKRITLPLDPAKILGFQEQESVNSDPNIWNKPYDNDL